MGCISACQPHEQDLGWLPVSQSPSFSSAAVLCIPLHPAMWSAPVILAAISLRFWLKDVWLNQPIATSQGQSLILIFIPMSYYLWGQGKIGNSLTQHIHCWIWTDSYSKQPSEWGLELVLLAGLWTRQRSVMMCSFVLPALWSSATWTVVNWSHFP